MHCIILFSLSVLYPYNSGSSRASVLKIPYLALVSAERVLSFSSEDIKFLAPGSIPLEFVGLRADFGGVK